MSQVIDESTGWNGASERILPVLASGGQTSNFRLELMAKDLRLAARMAASCGAPTLIASAVRALFDAGVNELGGAANLDEMSHRFEARAGVRFAGA